MTDTPCRIDWERYRAEFPAAARYVYFNHAAVCPLSTRVMAAIGEVGAAFLDRGILCEDTVFPRAEEVRAAAAKLIGAEPAEIAFTKNTTQGVLVAANGIRWREGDNVVMPSIEFPANVYPWKGLARRGVSIKLVPPAADGRVTAEMLADSCDGRTRAVTVSLVQFQNGYRIDAAALGRFCRERGIYFHVDAIQAAGMLRCDVREMRADFLSTGSQKWLLGPVGIGFTYVRREILGELDVWNPGWWGVKDMWDFLNYDQEYLADARRFEEGSKNLFGIYGMGAAIDRFLEIGPRAVEERILSLIDLLAARLAEKGYRVTSPRGPSERSGILCFTHPVRPTEEVHRILTEGSVVCGVRGGAVRLSPHFYNTPDEVERLVALL